MSSRISRLDARCTCIIASDDVEQVLNLIARLVMSNQACFDAAARRHVHFLGSC
jgi:hypothetical protein